MTSSRFNLHQKLLLLFAAIGFGGLLAFALVGYLVYHQLFNHFLPENRALRDLESRSASLVQTYYQIVFTPDLIPRDELAGPLALIRQSLARYRELVVGEADKQVLVDSISMSIDDLERAGLTLQIARQRFDQIHARQAQLLDEIDRVFEKYRAEVSADIGRSIDNQQWQLLAREYLPELRMLDSIQQQYLELFLEIRESQLDPGLDNSARIESLKQRIDVSNTMFDLFEENSAERGWLSTNVLVIYAKMIEILEQYHKALTQARFAVSLAEQSGIELNQSLGEAVLAAERSNRDELRWTLSISGALLVSMFGLGYAASFIGLRRVLRPLKSLQDNLARLGEGELQRRIAVESRDEIGRLVAEFNRMADRLDAEAVQRRRLIEELEQKNTELERFTYTVSHELKTPLVTVNGFLGLLERDIAAGDTSRIRGDIDKINRAVETMSRQLDDLLELSRVGRIVNPSQRFSPSDLCHEVLALIDGPVEQCGARIDIAPALPLVLADRVRVGEVIRNLVENAIKFHQGPEVPEVAIEAAPNDGRVEIRVCDNGPGIDPQYRDKVFELFDRLDDSVPGTGIGLALARRIVELHGGRIWIETPKNGQGSCFCFTLPAAAGEES